MRRLKFLSLVSATWALLAIAPDRLAASEPLPWSELSSQVVRVTTELRNSGAQKIFGTSSCPDEAHDVAIGGSCDAGDDAMVVDHVVLNGARTAAYSCRLKQFEENTTPLLVTVICVRNAR